MRAEKVRNWLIRLIYKRIISILFILFCVGIGISFVSMSHLSTKLIESQALQTARVNAQIMRDARSLYSSQVVDRLKDQRIDVTHNYLDKPGAIPLPTNYLIQLSHTVSEKNPGMTARLYSQYPFHLARSRKWNPRQF